MPNKRKKKHAPKKTVSWFGRLLGREEPHDEEFEDIDGDIEGFEEEELDEGLDEEICEEDMEEDEESMPVERTADGRTEELHINLIDRANMLIAQTIVPGLKESEIDINLNREMLSITTSSNDHCVEKGGDYLYEELIFGSFSRSILLPAEIDVEESTAEVKDGVLTITMPKINKAARKKISIKKK